MSADIAAKIAELRAPIDRLAEKPPHYVDMEAAADWHDQRVMDRRTVVRLAPALLTVVEAAADVLTAYKAYRARGAMPAPDQYAASVKALRRLDEALAALAKEDADG